MAHLHLSILRRRIKYLLSIFLLFLVASFCGVSAPPAAHAAATATWQHPLAGQWVIEQGFRAPATSFGPGHRGVDLRAASGTNVVAPRAGAVSFAGLVAEKPVVSVDHGDGWVTSHEAVNPAVTAGERVHPGQKLGSVGGGSHCSCLHFSARYQGAYVNPLLLFAQVPLAVLLPW